MFENLTIKELADFHELYNTKFTMDELSLLNKLLITQTKTLKELDLIYLTTNFSIDFANNKIEMIKLFRVMDKTLGLSEAKEKVEKMLDENITTFNITCNYFMHSELIKEILTRCKIINHTKVYYEIFIEED